MSSLVGVRERMEGLGGFLGAASVANVRAGGLRETACRRPSAGEFCRLRPRVNVLVHGGTMAALIQYVLRERRKGASYRKGCCWSTEVLNTLVGNPKPAAFSVSDLRRAECLPCT